MEGLDARLAVHLLHFFNILCFSLNINYNSGFLFISLMQKKRKSKKESDQNVK